MFSIFKKKPLLDLDDEERIVAAIRAAEAGTTGEIRVFVEARCSFMDAMDRAREVFFKLGMEKTERRNAVLIYLAVKDHQFALIGDQEIYSQAGGPKFWEEAARHLKDHLVQGKIAQGLEGCVRELGTALNSHFPFDPAVHKNELPDEIVFG